jgi:hypothetical protein
MAFDFRRRKRHYGSHYRSPRSPNRHGLQWTTGDINKVRLRAATGVLLSPLYLSTDCSFTIILLHTTCNNGPRISRVDLQNGLGI